MGAVSFIAAGLLAAARKIEADSRTAANKIFFMCFLKHGEKIEKPAARPNRNVDRWRRKHLPLDYVVSGAPPATD